MSAKKVREIEAYLGTSLGDYKANNTFVLAAPPDTVRRAVTAPHVVWVGWLPPELKITEGLQLQLAQLTRKRGDSSAEPITAALPGLTNLIHGRPRKRDYVPPSGVIELAALLVPQKRTQAELQSLAEQWQAEILGNTGIEAVVELKSTPSKGIEASRGYHERLRVKMEADHLYETVHWITRRKEVATVDKIGAYSTLNKWAAMVTQSNGTSSKTKRPTPLWEYGLSGQDQIIGIADTGLDTSNCLFYDPVNPVGSSHRKVVAYLAFDGSTTADRDGLHGHGTHVSGSAAGSCTCGLEGCGNATTAQDELNRRWRVNEHQGMAYNARIAVMDLANSAGCPEGAYSLSNVDYTLLDHLYDAGARVLSNSWGCSSASSDCYTYDSDLTLSLDNWAFEHLDTLVVFAAGNEGSLGTGSVSSPGLGKNFLTVGAARNSFQSFSEAYNTYVNYTYVRELYNREHCLLDCSETVQCCYLSEEDCCNGIGPDRVVNRECCASNRRAQLKGRDSWLIFSQDSVAPFSSVGPVNGGGTGTRIKPDILAPGEVIISANSNCGQFGCGSASSTQGETAALWWNQGTSMATPIAAGNAILVREYFMRGYYPTGVPNFDDSLTPSAALVKATIINAGQDIWGYIVDYPANTYVKLKDKHPTDYYKWIGHGRITMDRVLYFKDYTPHYRHFQLFAFQSTDDATSLDTGESHTFNFYNVGTRSPFTATLVWMDPAGESLVNDLDIEVMVDNNGTLSTYWGNSHYGTNTRDSSNNVERVLLKRSALPGIVNITVTISATSINAAQPQPYALVVNCDENGALGAGTTLVPLNWWLLVALAVILLFTTFPVLFTLC